jgi:hypothetical protein
MTYGGVQMGDFMGILRESLRHLKTIPFSIDVVYPYCSSRGLSRIKFLTDQKEIKGYTINCGYTFLNSDPESHGKFYPNIPNKIEFPYMIHKTDASMASVLQSVYTADSEQGKDIPQLIGAITLFFDHKIHDFFNPKEFSCSPYKSATYDRESKTCPLQIFTK